MYCCVGSLADSSTVVPRQQAVLTIFVLVSFMGVGNAGSQTLLRSIQVGQPVLTVEMDPLRLITIAFVDQLLSYKWRIGLFNRAMNLTKPKWALH